MNELINEKAVCRTALATPGLLIIIRNFNGKQSCLYVPLSVLGIIFTLNKDNLFKLNTKHEFAQLDSLNIVLNMEEIFQNSQLHFNLFWGVKFHCPFSIAGN